ncbi:MAG: sensor histidine kinase, partial [Armatimonadetes bacterium]|nr:sensor histidine kinase [Armatimonadota bacterium]
LQDITERKQAEELLNRSHEDLRNLTIYMNTKVEEEKKKIAREIHDGLGQLLTGIKMNLTLFGKNIVNEQNKTEKIDSIKKMLDTCIQTVHDITKELRPVILDDLGIIAALQTRIADFEESSGIKCEFTCRPQHFTVDSDLALSIYRIFLELLTNIIRHAKTKKVIVRFQKQKTKISLHVRDYGIGITEEQISSSLSFGLIGIRERLNIWNGKMEIEGVPGKGTTAKIQILI